jgi:hypothetical protein
MAAVNVSLTDTFDQWRIKTNSISTNLGDLSLLETVEKDSLVEAINELLLAVERANSNFTIKNLL